MTRRPHGRHCLHDHKHLSFRHENAGARNGQYGMQLPVWFQQTLSYDIIIAIVGGVLVLLVQHIFVSRVRPLYLRYTQHLPNFNNTVWNGFSDERPSSGQANTVFEIKQFGNKIRAKATRHVKSRIRTFHYRGTMYSGQIILEFYDAEGPGLIVGTTVLHIGSDLRTLRGASTYFHHDKGRVVATYSTYRRT